MTNIPPFVTKIAYINPRVVITIDKYIAIELKENPPLGLSIFRRIDPFTLIHFIEHLSSNNIFSATKNPTPLM